MGLTAKLDKLKLKTTSEDIEDDSGHAKPDNSDDIDEVDSEYQNILLSIIAQLRPGMDLSKITLPTFILEKKSMLERITNFFQIPKLLIDSNSIEDPLDRFIGVLRWYLASWHISPKAVKKPLNPVLGEVFTCYWDELPNNKSAYYLSEQISHHPPKSSYFYIMPEEKIRVDGVVIPKSRFLGNSSAAIMEGCGYVTLGKWDNEVYVMNQPNVYVRGILFGKMRTELGDHMYIKCERNGLEANIEFKTKGFIYGIYDAIEGIIKESETQKELFQISGKWNEVMYIKNIKTGKKEVLYDTRGSKTLKPKVRPLEEQWDFESRKLWKPTIAGLAKRNHELATEEKSKVENEQRIKAKKRLEDGVEFHPKFFREVNENDNGVKNLEYVIYKKFDLKEDPEVLRERLFTVAPIVPGQKFDEKFHYPAFKKPESN
ncbi:oxysterol-binding protein-like protein OBPalpha [Candida albicans P75010]|nr:oxysterol-binding protein-like protein OBPalpha [Candida albicans P75010]